MKKLAGRDFEDILQVGATPVTAKSSGQRLTFSSVLDSGARGHPAGRAQRDPA